MHWNINPEVFALGPLSIRYYGLLFAAAFFTGFIIIRRIYVEEGKPEVDLDSLLTHVMIGTIAGARLGHCLFYDPVHYLTHPIQILKVWEGGLASHGGAIGIFTALYIYTRKHSDQPYLRMLDRMVIVTALAGLFIRTGNFLNSEILGVPTDVPWAVVFARIDAVPRHPAQLYEALAYGSISVGLYKTYTRFRATTPSGLLLGLFLVMVFTFRFFIEFVKERQAAYGTDLPLSVGQLLSIPLVLLGFVLLFQAFRSLQLTDSQDVVE